MSIINYSYPLAELKCSYNDIQKVAHIVDFQQLSEVKTIKYKSSYVQLIHKIRQNP